MRRLLGVIAALVLAFGVVAAPAAADELPDPQNPTAVLEIDKTISDTDVGPGDELVYTIEVGSVTVRKTVIGDGPSRFEVELACAQDVDGTPTAVDVPGGADRTLSDASGITATYDDLPAGAECRLA